MPLLGRYGIVAAVLVGVGVGAAVSAASGETVYLTAAASVQGLAPFYSDVPSTPPTPRPCR